MSRRDHIINILTGILSAALAVAGAYFGLPVPHIPPVEPQQPPAQVQPQAPAPVRPPAVPVPTADPMAARVKLSTSKGGCTGVVIGPVRSDGRYLVASAAHCVTRVGESASGTLPSGESLALVVQSIDRRADCSWMLTGPAAHPLPFAELAAAPAAVGRRVWVAGYGTHAPGVQRWGTVAAVANRDGQCRYRIAVSPGDSGGPIVDDVTGEVLGVVCCTSAFGTDADVYAAGPAALGAAKPKSTVLDLDWVPVIMPNR